MSIRTVVHKVKKFTWSLLQPFHGDDLRAQVIRDGAGSITVKIAATGLLLLVSVLLARILGPEGYGIYSYVLALISVMAMPAQFGFPELVVRETAKAQVHNEWGLLRGIWGWSFIWVCVLSAALIVLALVLAVFFSGEFNCIQRNTFFWGLTLVPLLALTRLCGSMLQGLRKVIHGQTPDTILRPTLLILSVSIASLSTSGKHITASKIMALHATSAMLALVIAAWLVHRLKPAEIKTGVVPIYRVRLWISSVLPLAFIAGMGAINTQTDLIILGLIMTPTDVGVYRVAAQGSTVVSFGLGAIAAVSMPYYAQFHANGEMGHLQRLATAGARIMLITAIPIVLIFIIWGEGILRLVFGVEYISAYSALVILSISHIFHAGFGILGPLLNMAGYERITAKGIAFAAVCNVILNFLLIPLYGINGAALSTGATLVIWNISLWIAVRKTIGIDTTALNIEVHNYKHNK